MGKLIEQNFVNVNLNCLINIMSFASLFEPLKQSTRIIINDRFIADEGAKELAVFLDNHRRVELLEVKSNEITSEGFIQIFNSLRNNPQIRQINLEYNNLGSNNYNDWESHLASLLVNSSKLQRLNISSNKINSESFKRIANGICNSKSLKLLQIRYNSISSTDIDLLLTQLKASHNQCLLYLELSGNKIKKESIQSLDNYLKQNRSKNPVSKDKLMMTGGIIQNSDNTIINVNSANTFYMNKTNAIDDLSKQNVLRHLEDILDQNRKDTTQMKIRLQRQFQQLQKRQKNDQRQLTEMDRKCNQLMIQNRNMKFQLDRTVSQHQQVQRDQDHHIRLHQQKLREANKQLLQLESKYEQIEERMAKQHQIKMKQIARQWEARLRAVQQKIRTSQNDNNILENEIKKNMEKKERLRVQYLDQQSSIRTRIEDEESQRYGFKISALQSRLKQVEQTRERYIRRNQDLIYQVQRTQTNNNRQIVSLEEQLSELKIKQEQFVQRNKDFLNRNQKLKSDIGLKEINIQKLQEEVNRLNEQIEHKKTYNREQITKIITDHAYSRGQKEQDKKNQIQRLNQLQATLRNSQLQNSKLRQQYAILAQRLQISLGQAVQSVFSQNHLY